MRKNVKKGFTLAEVLVVLVILGVIAALTMPSLMSSATNAKRLAAFKIGYTTLTNLTATGRIDGTWASAVSGEDSVGAITDYLAENIDGGEKFEVKSASGTNTWVQGENGIAYRVETGEKDENGRQIYNIIIDTDGTSSDIGINEKCLDKNGADAEFPKCTYYDQFKVYTNVNGVIKPRRENVKDEGKYTGYGLLYQILYGKTDIDSIK